MELPLVKLAVAHLTETSARSSWRLGPAPPSRPCTETSAARQMSRKRPGNAGRENATSEPEDQHERIEEHPSRTVPVDPSGSGAEARERTRRAR